MQPDYAVGTDIVEVERLRELGGKHGNRFYLHVYTENEVQWCNKRDDPHVHFAGKFAAKEAVKKALLALGETESIPVNIIEIHRQNDGPPRVTIKGSLSRTYRFQVSISHTRSLATAVAIAEVA